MWPGSYFYKLSSVTEVALVATCCSRRRPRSSCCYRSGEVLSTETLVEEPLGGSSGLRGDFVEDFKFVVSLCRR